MRWKHMLLVAGLLLGAVAAFAGLRFWQEASAGTATLPEASPGAQAGTREVAFVSNAVGGTVTLIDIAAAEVIGTLGIVPDGTRVGAFRDPVQWIAQGEIESRGGKNYAQDSDVSPDGRVLYVSRGHLGDVAAFDIASGDLIWRRSVAGFRADHMDISPDGSRLFVAGMTADQMDVLDAHSGERTARVDTGVFPHDIHAKAGGHLYVASLGDMSLPLEERGADPAAYTIGVFDPADLSPLGTHRFEAGVRPFHVTHGARRIYAQLSNEHAVIAYDPETEDVVDRLDLPVAEGVTEEDWDFEAPHHGLAATPDDRLLCLAGRASDYAAIVRTEPLELIATVPLGDAPSWAAMASGGERCLLANSRSDDVSIVSMAEAREVARLPAGRGAKHITVADIPVDVLAAVRSRGRQ